MKLWGFIKEKDKSTVNEIISQSLLTRQICVSLTVSIIIKCMYPAVCKMDLH